MNQVTVVDFLLVMLFSWLCFSADGLRIQELQTSRLMPRNIFHQKAQFLPEFLVPYSHRLGGHKADQLSIKVPGRTLRKAGALIVKGLVSDMP